MALTARLTPQEEEAITEFLMGAARPIANSPEPRPEAGALVGVTRAEPDVLSGGDLSRGAAVYGAQCKVCHGEQGKGDGPVAATLTPPPPDLTRSERMRMMSDEELFELLSVGKGSMPGFREILTEEERGDVLKWLRSLNGARE